MIRGFALLATLQAAGAWHATLLSRPSVARHAPLAMQLGMFGEKVQDGFRGDDKTRKEAEEALSVSISSDAALWEEFLLGLKLSSAVLGNRIRRELVRRRTALAERQLSVGPAPSAASKGRRRSSGGGKVGGKVCPIQ